MPGAGFPKSARLTRRLEFQQVRDGNRSIAGRWFRLSALQTDNDSPARLGIITTRKSGSAVERTRFRRLIREAFRLQRASLPTGLWLVVIARTGAGQAPFQSVRDEWLRLLSRLSIVDGSR
jgi:ribonuclease P protein component